MREQWLCHHGVKGMKWGIRLYQRKDGTLTPLGRHRYFDKNSKLTKAGKKAFTEDNGVLSERGLALIKAHTKVADTEDSEIEEYFKQHSELVIKKGEELVRYALPDEPLDNKRKYVAYGKDLSEKYRDFASSEMLGFRGNDYATYTYTTKKDVNVKVLTPDDVLNGYLAPGKLEQQKIDLSSRQMATPAYSYGKAKKERELVFVDRAIRKSRNYVNSLYSEELENIKPKLVKQGYDAVVDWNDVNLSLIKSGKTEYPVVILDPKKTMKLTKYQTDPWSVK